MPIAKGVSRVVAIAKESTWGTAPGTGTARQLRRVTATMDLKKDNYQSGEIRTSQQVSDMRHGTRSVESALNGELSAGSYFDLMEGLVARDFAPVAPVTGLGITIATSGTNYTITRATGSWLTAGISPGLVVRLTAGTFNAANLNKNVYVISATALVLTVKVMNGTAMIAEGPIASATLTVPGEVTFAPLTSHTDQSFTIEDRFTDINVYERYVGNKVTSMAVSVPSSGMTTVDFSLVGKDKDRKDVTPYFVNPTAQSNSGVAAAVNGALLLNGALVAIVTSVDFTVERATENAMVVGSNSLADVFTGRITASGTVNLYFMDRTVSDLFDDETEFMLAVSLTENNLAAANAVSFVFPRVKLSDFTKPDGENGITASAPFTALENSVTTGGLYATTVMIQDTSLT